MATIRQCTNYYLNYICNIFLRFETDFSNSFACISRHLGGLEYSLCGWSISISRHLSQYPLFWPGENLYLSGKYSYQQHARGVQLNGLIPNFQQHLFTGDVHDIVGLVKSGFNAVDDQIKRFKVFLPIILLGTFRVMLRCSKVRLNFFGDFPPPWQRWRWYIVWLCKQVDFLIK